MNGARSIFMSKGYWLTALATAVLLAASSGTALAQMGTASVGFDRASTSVTEGDTDSDDLAILKVVRTAIEGEDLVDTRGHGQCWHCDAGGFLGCGYHHRGRRRHCRYPRPLALPPVVLM